MLCTSLQEQRHLSQHGHVRKDMGATTCFACCCVAAVGDQVPADCRMLQLQSNILRADQVGAPCCSHDRYFFAYAFVSCPAPGILHALHVLWLAFYFPSKHDLNSKHNSLREYLLRAVDNAPDACRTPVSQLIVLQTQSDDRCRSSRCLIQAFAVLVSADLGPLHVCSQS